jgi:hypothetical protein
MLDWTGEAPKDESGLAAVTWCTWAEQTADAIKNGPEERRLLAITTLRKLADYLDDQYYDGYHGIAPFPLDGCNMGWGW